MRILWLSHFLPYPPTGHGALQRSHQLLRQAAQRHEVHLVALVPPGTFASPAALDEARAALGALVASVRAIPMPADPRGIRRARLALTSALTSGPDYWERWFALAAMRDGLAALARERRFDLVHLDAIFLAPYLASFAPLPLVLNHHNLESHLLRRRAEQSGSRLARHFFLSEATKVERRERELAARARVNIVVSDLDGARLRAVVPDARVATVPNGVDVDFFRAPTSVVPVPSTMTFAGGMDWFPNRDAMQWFASDVWPAVARGNPARRAAIIGRNAPAELVALGERDPRVRVLGFVDDVRPHLAAAETYVCPIRVGGGTRLKILDALAMERPLVATRLSVEGLDLVDGIHYLAAETSDDFHHQLARLEGAPELRARLAAAGRRFVEARYSWSTIGQALDRAYQEATTR